MCLALNFIVIQFSFQVLFRLCCSPYLTFHYIFLSIHFLASNDMLFLVFLMLLTYLSTFGNWVHKCLIFSWLLYLIKNVALVFILTVCRCSKFSFFFFLMSLLSMSIELGRMKLLFNFTSTKFQELFDRFSYIKLTKKAFFDRRVESGISLSTKYVFLDVVILPPKAELLNIIDCTK